MDTRQLKPKLRKFLSQFDDCFLRKDTRSHLPTNVEGQLSSLQDKSVAPIALKAGVAPRTLQEFLSQLKWDQDKLAIGCRTVPGANATGLGGKKNPEVTECQVQTALGALIPCWWLDQRPAAKLLVRTAEEIRQNQHKSAEARQSHIKRTRERLRELGIKLTEIPRCRWGAT